MVSRRMASKFLGFDALKGMNERISVLDNDYIEPITLSDEDKENMDIDLIKAYMEKREIEIKQYKKGKLISLTGVIDKIDMIAHEVILTGRKRVPFESIVYLSKN